MATTDPNTADPGAAGPAAGVPATAGQPDWESTDNPYKPFAKRFTGMQAEYQRLQTAHATLEGTHFDLDKAHKDLVGAKEAQALQLSSLQGDHAQSVEALKTLAGKFGRASLLMTDFPDLIPLEAKGLLPDGGGDELKTKLGLMRETLKTLGNQQAAAIVTGATPLPPNPAAAKTASQLLTDGNALIQRGQYAEGNRMLDEYFKTLK